MWDNPDVGERGNIKMDMRGVGIQIEIRYLLKSKMTAMEIMEAINKVSDEIVARTPRRSALIEIPKED